MLKELGAWGKALRHVSYGCTGVCPVPFRDRSRMLLIAESGPTVTAMSSQSWGYLLSHGTFPDQSWVVALVRL